MNNVENILMFKNAHLTKKINNLQKLHNIIFLLYLNKDYCKNI